jgi:hypothetical protein
MLVFIDKMQEPDEFDGGDFNENDYVGIDDVGIDDVGNNNRGDSGVGSGLNVGSGPGLSQPLSSTPSQPNSNKNQPGFFYIIKTPDVPPDVYKIGKTIQTDPNKRLCRYPPYSCTQYTVAVANADLFEDIVMRKLKGSVIRRREYGLEYYQSDIKILIDQIHNLWLSYGDLTDTQLDKTIEKIKPNGWQFFANEWLSKHPGVTASEAHLAYISIMRDVFASNEYAELDAFSEYFRSVQL